MRYPSQKEILEVLAEIEESEKRGITRTNQGLPYNATPIDKLKFKICQNILRFKRLKSYSSKDIAKLIDADEAVVSRLLHCHINKFKVETLLNYYRIILITSKQTSLLKSFDERLEMLVDDDLKYGL